MCTADLVPKLRSSGHVRMPDEIEKSYDYSWIVRTDLQLRSQYNRTIEYKYPMDNVDIAFKNLDHSKNQGALEALRARSGHIIYQCNSISNSNSLQCTTGIDLARNPLP